MTKILVCLLFKNSNLWLSRFFDNVDTLIDNEYNKKNNINYNLSIVYGTSNDGTEESLNDRIEKHKEIAAITKIDIPNRFNHLERLAILRNTFLQINNTKKYDYLLMIDTDVMFETSTINHLLKLIQNSKLENIGIIAPMIFIEDYSIHKNNFFYDTLAYRINNLNFKHLKPYIPNITENNDKHKRIIEVDSVGSLYIMKSEIITSNKDVCYGTYLINSQHESKKYESEQVYLCNQVRKKGFKIYVDLNSKVYHINLEKYGLRWH